MGCCAFPCLAWQREPKMHYTNYNHALRKEVMMQLNEIKEHIKPLSLMEKVQLIQDGAEMLKP